MWFEGQSALGVIVAVRLWDLDVPVMLGIAAAAGSFASGWIGRLQMSLTLINVTPKSAVVKKKLQKLFLYDLKETILVQPVENLKESVYQCKASSLSSPGRKLS